MTQGFCLIELIAFLQVNYLKRVHVAKKQGNGD